MEEDGLIHVGGFNLYFRSVGAIDSPDVLIGLHGGPGATLDYLKVLEDLKRQGIRIVLYNQLGSDKSDVPKDHSYYTIEHYVEELEGVRVALGLGKKIHLVGHSWGGMLAIAYALKYQENLSSLIIASCLASVPLAQRETDKLVEAMPFEARSKLQKYSREKRFGDPEYTRAYQKFVREPHSYRGTQLPNELDYTLKHINRDVFSFMEGPDDLNMTGTLKDWDVTDQLHSLKLPTLITVGRHDLLTPAVSESIHNHIPGSQLVIFENSAHFAMWEEKDKFVETIGKFIEELRKKR